MLCIAENQEQDLGAEVYQKLGSVAIFKKCRSKHGLNVDPTPSSKYI